MSDECQVLKSVEMSAIFDMGLSLPLERVRGGDIVLNKSGRF